MAVCIASALARARQGRDAAEQRVSELQDRQREAALELAAIDHDLRTPIGTIGSALALMTDGNAEPALRAEAAAVISRQVARMTALTQRLHEVSSSLALPIGRDPSP